MKISENWLREWVNPPLNRNELSLLLTNSGFEIEEIAPAAKKFSNVIVGIVEKIKKHPEADLSVVDVNIGRQKKLVVVCGAKNVRENLKVAVATVNAILPDSNPIQIQTIRGVTSEGMLLSANELGLTDEADKIIELPRDAQIGHDLWEYYRLEDYIFDVSITPNRGDCLSVKGFAREVAAITQTPLHDIEIPVVPATKEERFKVNITAEDACPHYIGRTIRGIKIDTATPTWIKERLRRGGIRSINAVVDCVNYVMLELGQPMHAFDLDKINTEIVVRYAKDGEEIILLDGSEQTLNTETLIIADKEQPLAIAGVMGGLNSSVTLLTQAIFLESAYFTSKTVAQSRQYYNLTSDSAYRYERGVDPQLQQIAMLRVSELIVSICGGEAGPMLDVVTDAFPRAHSIKLAKQKITRLLGIVINDNDIENIFSRLNFTYEKIADGWQVAIPSFRFDVQIPEDLIEEIGRLYGFDKIPPRAIKANLAVTENLAENINQKREMMASLGYHEVITYSFIDDQSQQLFDPHASVRRLSNPISSDMVIMRSSLWPGLVKTMLYNQDRQQDNVKIFEIGKIFLSQPDGVEEKLYLSGLITGKSVPEQWGLPSRDCDFYDIKGHLEMFFNRLLYKVDFRPATHHALHPGQTAAIHWQDKQIGFVGVLHPSIAKALEIKQKVCLYELNLNMLTKKESILGKSVAKFPEIRRDIAIVVNEAVPVKKIQDTIKRVAGDWLKENFIFDVYQGKGISSGYKSVALALILQDSTRTLTDAEISELMERLIIALKEQFGAELRS